MLRLLPFVLVFALWVWAFIDCLTTPDEEVRHLPKVVWVIIILLFGEVLVGPVAWLLIGRRRGAGASSGSEPQYRGGPDVAPDDNPEFLASLGRDNQRHEAMLKQWEADLRRRERQLRAADQQDDEQPEDGKGRPQT